MNPDEVKAVIGDLYLQVVSLSKANERLTVELKAVKLVKQEPTK